MIERMDLGKLVTFVPNKSLPIYSWFYYKEGFSRDFVIQMFKELEVKENETVLDPFMGVGTTLLASREHGCPSYGLDVSDIAVLASKVKTRNYNIDELIEQRKKIFAHKMPSDYRHPRVSSIVRRAFKEKSLNEIFFYKNIVNGIDDEKVKNFFLLALINASNKSSFAFKDGAVIKIKKRPVPPMRDIFKRITKKMIKDIGKIHLKNVPAYPMKADAREMPLQSESVDVIITSPPYLNKIEYTQVYSIENELFFGKQERGLPSAIGLDVRLDPKEILELHNYLKGDDPLIAYKYFRDMKKVIEEMYRVTKPGGKVVIVVGNGCFPDRVIESDYIVTQLAQDIGFSQSNILVVNQRLCMRDRVKRVGPLRESVVILKKSKP